MNAFGYRLAAFNLALVLAGGAGAPVHAQSGTQLWSRTVSGAVWAPLAHHGGRLYFGSDDSTFYALDLREGEVGWRFDTGGIIRSGAVVAGGLVLFASDDGYLYALEEATGSEVWRFDLASGDLSRVLPSPDPPYEYDWAHSTPTVRDGLVYVGSATGELYAVDLGSGEERWRFESGGKIRSSPTVDGGNVYVGSWDGHVYALNAADGSLRWGFDTGGIVQGATTVGEGRVFAGSRSAAVFALDTRTGELVWKHVHEDGSWVESSPVYRDGVVYVGSSDALSLFALDATSGEEIWRFETGGWSWSTPLVTERTVYIGGLSAFPYYFEGVDLRSGFFAVDRSTGAVAWDLIPEPVEGYVTGGVLSTPVAADGIIYVAGLDGRLYAIRE